MRISHFCCLLGFVLSFFLKAHGATSPYAGYTNDVQSEKSQRFYEVYLLAPQKAKEPSLQEMIFNPLTKEFKEKYREKFGELDTGSISSRTAAMGGTTENPKALEDQTTQRKEFAEYMTKRLVEYHFDQYMKTQPQMKPVMEVKQKIQNVKVEVSKEIRMNIQYNFAGNTADVVLDNPWCESKLTVEMNPGSFGPSTPQEMRFWINKQINTRWKANTNLATTDGIAYGDLTRTFVKWKLATTLGLSSAFKGGGTSPRETKYIVGLSHSF